MDTLASQRVDVVQLDLGMTELDGAPCHKAIRIAAPSIPVVVLTGNTEPAVREETFHQGAAYYLPKPLTTLTEIRRCLIDAARNHRPRRQMDL
ncbi:MAG: response regulator [Bryobacteraceae bacterium]